MSCPGQLKIKIYFLTLYTYMHIYISHTYTTCNMCGYSLGFLHFMERMEDLMKATHLRACMLAASKPFVVFFPIPRGCCLFLGISSHNIFFHHFYENVQPFFFRAMKTQSSKLIKTGKLRALTIEHSKHLNESQFLTPKTCLVFVAQNK